LPTMIVRSPSAKKRARKKYRREQSRLKARQRNWLARYKGMEDLESSRLAGLSEYCSDEKFAYASEMRHDMTPTERAFWMLATPRRLGFKLYRQVVVLGYIVDFYSFEYKIAVEIDGSVHKNPKQVIWDAERDEAMRSAGILVMRFRATVDEHEILGHLFRLREAFLRRSSTVSSIRT